MKKFGGWPVLPRISYASSCSGYPTPLLAKGGLNQLPSLIPSAASSRTIFCPTPPDFFLLAA
jgi:hypothetical protein